MVLADPVQLAVLRITESDGDHHGGVDSGTASADPRGEGGAAGGAGLCRAQDAAAEEQSGDGV